MSRARIDFVVLFYESKGTVAELEARRRFAADLLRHGKNLAETAKLAEASLSSLIKELARRGLQYEYIRQTNPNWKKRRFCNLLILQNFHRGTHLGGSRDFETFRAQTSSWLSRFRRSDSHRHKSITVDVYEKRKARQLVLTSLFCFEPGCNSGISGGGGDRTRVPRHFHDGLYVCSRLFKFHRVPRQSTD